MKERRCSHGRWTADLAKRRPSSPWSPVRPSASALTLVFSSALVVRTLAASQFGSFLLHDFIRMRISRLTLSMFVATFVYSLMILSRVGEGTSQPFVPEISSKVAMVLTFLSLALLSRLAPFLTTREQRDALAAQAGAAADEALKTLALDTDRSAVLDCYTHTCQILGRPAFQDRTLTSSTPATSIR